MGKVAMIVSFGLVVSSWARAAAAALPIWALFMKRVYADKNTEYKSLSGVQAA